MNDVVEEETVNGKMGETMSMKESVKDLDDFLAGCRECKRALAVKLVLMGAEYAFIEELLQVSASFIRKWRARYEHGGVDSLYEQYKGSEGYLSPAERTAVITFLMTKEYYGFDQLCAYVEEHYGVVYKSRQSYYDLFHEAHISWKKTEHTNPARDEANVQTRRTAINALLKARRQEIEAGELVVVLEDECHLLWGDTLGYVWGRMNHKIPVPITNIRARQTYYGAINLATNAFHVCPLANGDSVHTVKFVKYLQACYPQAKLLLIWDGASYHQYAEMQTYLQEVNHGLEKPDWRITCELLAPNAPDQNPVEDIWLKGKNFLRKFFYKLTTFAKTKQAFLDFLQTTSFDFSKLALYAYK